MFEGSKSYTTLFFCSILHIGISISSALFGKIEGGEFFFSIPEYLVGAGYIIALFLAVHDDYMDDLLGESDKMKHTITVIVAAVVLKILMAFLAQVGVWLIITGVLLVILFCAFGGTSSMIFIGITSYFGVWGPIFGVILTIVAAVSATFVW